MSEHILPDGTCHLAIYDHPKDYPGEYLMRAWYMGPSVPIPGEIVAHSISLEEVRRAVPPGFIRIANLPGEDPVIVETWI